MSRIPGDFPSVLVKPFLIIAPLLDVFERFDLVSLNTYIGRVRKNLLDGIYSLQR